MINISSIFAKSPFKPLRDHMDKVVESVIPLNDFFEALFQQDYSKLEKIQQQVIQAENEADSIKNEVRNNLPRNIFMPINRRDLLEMLDMQDSIADVAQDIVILLNIRKMKLPEELSQDVFKFVKKSQDVCYLARGLTQEFGDVIESGFGRHEIKKLLQMIDNVSIAETEADNLEDALVRRLYEVEEKMNSVDAVFWYKIFELIGDIADFSKKTGNRLRLMIASK
ncbi:MAG: TIGR00153 family protein [Pseudomonadota bacterium]|nr:MAG: TIGR00153 family protein [Pseudomonadota bacterium]